MTTVPNRGKIHPIFSLYVGGNALTDTYCLVPANLYSSTSPLCNEKGIQVTDSSDHGQCNNTASIKFNWKLNVTNNNSSLFNSIWSHS